MDESRRNGKRSGRGGKDGRTARNATENGTELAKTRVVNGDATDGTETLNERRTKKRDGQNGGVERVARNETERRVGTGGRRLRSERGGREPLC